MYTNDHQNDALHAGLFAPFDENVGQKNCHSTGKELLVLLFLLQYSFVAMYTIKRQIC